MESVAAGQWKFTDGKSWNRDEQIRVSCLDSEESGLPRCLYEDQTAFLGEDLPAVFGGGGVETNNETSAECIDLCEKTSGCRYWTWIMEERVNCFLKKSLVNTERRPKHVSGSDPSACTITSPVVTTPITTPAEPTEEPKYNENEINGKFKIMMGWNDKFNDPESEEYQDLANTIETDLEDMLRKERDLSEQVEEFTVTVEKFRRGSVVCDFKVNYILKEAYIAIPFAIKPSNITNAMGNNVKFKKGILFQRFLIAGGSFNASSPVDHCSAKGCSHKCNYDYSVEDYVCTCPPTLQLASDGLTCLQEPEASSRLPEIEVTFLPTDCLWSPWSDWSQCSLCGTPGQRERKRTVAVPEKNGGSCLGSDQEFVECEEICEETDSSTDEPSVEVVTSVSTETGDEGEGRADTIDTTLANEVTEKTTDGPIEVTEQTIENLEPETEIDVEDNVMDQSSEMESTTDTAETSGEVEQSLDQSTEEQKPTTEEIVTEATTGAETEKDENVTETDEGIIYPLSEDPTETETTTATLEEEDFGRKLPTEQNVMMSTESVIEMTTESEMDPIVQYTTTKQGMDTSYETTMESVTSEKVTEVAVDISTEDSTTTDSTVMSMETQTTTASSEPLIPSEVVGEVTETTSAEVMTEVTEVTTTSAVETESPDAVEMDTTTEVMNEEPEVSNVVTEPASPMETTPVEEILSKEPRIDVEAEMEADMTTSATIQEVPAVSTQTDIDSLSQVIEVTTVMEDELTTVNNVKMSEADTEDEDDMEPENVTTEKNIEDVETTSMKQMEEVTTVPSVTEGVTVKETPVEVTETIATEVMTETLVDSTTPSAVETESPVEVDMDTTTEVMTEKDEVVDIVTETASPMETTPVEEILSKEPRIDIEAEMEAEMTTSATIQEVPAVSTQTDVDSLSQETERPMEAEIDTTTEMVEVPKVVTEAASSVETTTTEELEVELTTVKKEAITESSVEVTTVTGDELTTVADVKMTTVNDVEMNEARNVEVSTNDEEIELNAEDVTTEGPMVELETTSMKQMVEVTTVEVMSETEADMTMVTTVRPRLEEAVTTTVSPVEEDGADQEFLCQPAGSQSDSGDLNMNCVHTTGDQDRTVMILIPRDVIGDISLDRLYDKNVKIVVKDFMVMDRSPRRL